MAANLKTGRRLCFSIVFLVVYSHAAGHAVYAQSLPKIPQIQPFGLDGFRLMLQQRGLRATPDRVGTALNEKPEETVAVVIGDLKTVTEGGGIRNKGRGIQDQLTNFVRKGGALLVASDLRGQRIRSASICNTWIQEQKRWLRTPREKQNAYHGFADCPVVTLFRNREPVLFDGVTRLVTNRPSALRNSERSANIAYLPMTGNPPLMCVKYQGKGKMLFIADHSIFVNEMLVHGDNARFANNVTQWLCDSEERTRLVLIHDGNVLHDWTFGESPPSIPLSSLLQAARYGSLANLPVGDSMLPFLNEAMSRSQQENEFNYAARKAAFAMAGGRGVRFAMLVMTSFLATWFLGWLVTTRWRPRRWLSFQDWQQPNRVWSRTESPSSSAAKAWSVRNAKSN